VDLNGEIEISKYNLLNDYRPIWCVLLYLRSFFINHQIKSTSFIDALCNQFNSIRPIQKIILFGGISTTNAKIGFLIMLAEIELGLSLVETLNEYGADQVMKVPRAVKT